MANIDFPNNPSLNDTFTANGRTWIFIGNGIWDTVETSIITGPTGPANTLTLGTVETSLPGETGSVSITGSAPNQTISFVIPQGPTGPETSLTIGSVSTGLPGTTGSVSITGPAGDQVLSFTLPQGPTGPETSISIGTVSTALPGGSASASVTGPPGSQVLSLTIPQGPTGPETSISLGTINTGLPGSTASVAITGPAGNQILSFTIPQGPTGPNTSISIGTIDTGLPGSTASASVTGSPGSQVLSLTIPQGPTGPATSISLGSVSTALPGSTGSVSITGPAGNQILSFTLPQGPTGPETSISIGTVNTGSPGSSATASITGPAGSQVLSFTIPQGPTGPSNTLTVGTVTSTGPDGTPVVSITGSSPNQTINFILQQGPTGPAGSIGTVTLDDLNDVTISGPTANQVLKYNGTAWVNDTDSIGVGSANQIIYKNSSNVATGSSGLQYDGVSLKVNGNLESTYSNGDEGGEIFLNKATTNTTITNGVTIDVHQNKLRFFEQGGSNRGYYLDITAGGSTVGTNLAVSLPSQTGNSGELLVTNGTDASWSNTVTANSSTVPAIIAKATTSQTGNIQEWQPAGSTTPLAAISSSGLLSANVAEPTVIADTAKAVGYVGIPQFGGTNANTGALTLTKAHAGETVYTTTSRIVTIPANNVTAFEVGTTIVFVSGQGATTTIAINSDTLQLVGSTTATPAGTSRTLAPFGIATAIKVAPTIWYISGNGLA